ncbi:unnamed protein product [Linum trigynum]|uniref:Uncharacterized protein n=1 Tax=Linum trigynum TaxID=586398 RepID=A0AAV2DP45_9ROSI
MADFGSVTFWTKLPRAQGVSHSWELRNKEEVACTVDRSEDVGDKGAKAVTTTRRSAKYKDWEEREVRDGKSNQKLHLRRFIFFSLVRRTSLSKTSFAES